jgi:membrane protein implicated in regulation of membrane protease activity
MWILHFLPDWIFHAIVLIGLAGFVLGQFFSWLPLIGKYLIPVRILSVVLLTFGLFMEGANYNNNVWEARVKELEEKVKVSEEKSKELNNSIKTKVIEKIKTVKDVQVIIQDRIVEKKEIIDADCKVSTEAIKILNDSAKMKSTVEVEPLKKDDKQ